MVLIGAISFHARCIDSIQHTAYSIHVRMDACGEVY